MADRRGNTKEPKVKDTGRQSGAQGMPEQCDRGGRGTEGSVSRPKSGWYNAGEGVPKSKPANPAGC